MTIPVKVRIRRRKAAATCEDSAGRVVQLDLSHVIISVNTGKAQLLRSVLGESWLCFVCALCVYVCLFWYLDLDSD